MPKQFDRNAFVTAVFIAALFVSTTMPPSGAVAEDKPVIKILSESHLSADENVGVWIREHNYQPGWKAPTHFHNSDLFIYVVSGAFEVTTEESGRVVYLAGEAMEMMSNTVMDARNASDTEPLKLAVVQVGAVDQPFVMPVE